MLLEQASADVACGGAGRISIVLIDRSLSGAECGLSDYHLPRRLRSGERVRSRSVNAPIDRASEWKTGHFVVSRRLAAPNRGSSAALALTSLDRRSWPPGRSPLSTSITWPAMALAGNVLAMPVLTHGHNAASSRCDAGPHAVRARAALAGAHGVSRSTRSSGISWVGQSRWPQADTVVVGHCPPCCPAAW
jgi:hypothetical protein